MSNRLGTEVGRLLIELAMAVIDARGFGFRGWVCDEVARELRLWDVNVPDAAPGGV